MYRTQVCLHDALPIPCIMCFLTSSRSCLCTFSAIPIISLLIHRIFIYLCTYSAFFHVGSDYRGQVQASIGQETEVSAASGLIMCESSTSFSGVFTAHVHVYTHVQSCTHVENMYNYLTLGAHVQQGLL